MQLDFTLWAFDMRLTFFQKNCQLPRFHSVSQLQKPTCMSQDSQVDVKASIKLEETIRQVHNTGNQALNIQPIDSL